MEAFYPYNKINQAAQLYESVVSLYNPYVRVALVSGGDDSMTLIEVLRWVGEVDYVVHVDTTTGLEATQEHVYNYCNANKLPLIITRTNEETFEEIVLESGFPGPAQHGTMYIRLKERALRLVQRRFQLENSFCMVNGYNSPSGKRQTPLIADPETGIPVTKSKRIIMYFTGARSDESVRRMGNVVPVSKEGNQVWVNLIHNFTKSDVHQIQAQNKVVRNPASSLIGLSCECLDGAFGDNNELRLITSIFHKDKTVKMLNNLECRLKGHKYGAYGHGGLNKNLPIETTSAALCSTCINNRPSIPG